MGDVQGDVHDVAGGDVELGGADEHDQGDADAGVRSAAQVSQVGVAVDEVFLGIMALRAS